MIKINRKAQFINYFAKYKIIIDGIHIRDICSGTAVKFDIDEGYHKIYIKCDWCRSNEIEFLYNKNVEIEFDVLNSLKGPLIIFSIFTALFMPHHYLKLKKK